MCLSPLRIDARRQDIRQRTSSKARGSVEGIGLVFKSVVGAIIQKAVGFSVLRNHYESIESLDGLCDSRITVDMFVVPDQVIYNSWTARAIPTLLGQLRPRAVRKLVPKQKFDIRSNRLFDPRFPGWIVTIKIEGNYPFPDICRCPIRTIGPQIVVRLCVAAFRPVGSLLCKDVRNVPIAPHSGEKPPPRTVGHLPAL